MDGYAHQLSPELTGFLAEVQLAASIEDVGHIELGNPNPCTNGFLAKWPHGVVVKVADIYSGENFQERSLLLRDGCRMPAPLYMQQWMRRAEYSRN